MWLREGSIFGVFGRLIDDFLSLRLDLLIQSVV
jgi:hypothetical protein